MMSSNFIGGAVDASLDQAKEIKFNNVFQSKVVDLAFTTDSTYYGNPQGNVAKGDFAVINVNAGSSVDVVASLMVRDEAQLYSPIPFYFTIAGLAQFVDEAGGKKYVTIGGFDASQVTTGASVESVTNDDGTMTFSSTTIAKKADDFKPPVMSLNMGSQNVDNSVTIEFTATNQFRFTLTVDEGRGDRSFYLAGASNLICERRAVCDTFTCPATYEKRLNVSHVYCAGSECDENDLSTCCIPSILEECSAEATLTFTDTTKAVANLGGSGPKFTEAQEIRIIDVFADAANPIDMVITNTTPYIHAQGSHSGLDGAYIIVDVEHDTSVSLSVDFYVSGTYDVVTIPYPFTLGIFDFDMQENGAGKEQISISGYDSFVLTDDTTIQKSVDHGKATFTAGVAGTAADNPTDPMHQTKAQLDKTVSVVFATGTSHFDMTMNVLGGFDGGRQILMSGWTSQESCPPVVSYCAHLGCPMGFMPKPGFESLRCAGATCTSADYENCCDIEPYSICSSEKRVQFSAASLKWNNLGGAGPDQGGAKIVSFDDMFPSNKAMTGMRMSVDGKYAWASDSNPPDNVLIGGFFRLQVLAQSRLSLKIEFLDEDEKLAEKYSSLTVLGFSATPGGKPLHSLEVTGMNFYNLSLDTKIDVTESTSAQGDLTATFTSSSQILEDSVPLASSLELTAAELAHAVSLRFKNKSEVTLHFEVAAGAGYHTFYISGTSSLMCPVQAAMCNTMVCPPATHKLKTSAASLTCAGSKCTTDADLFTCCEEVSYLTDCAPETDLSLTSANLLVNNLGGHGPDKGEQKLLFANVFPRSDRVVNLEVRNMTPYFPGDAKRNGVRDTFGILSTTDGTSTDFEFRLVDSTGMLISRTDPFLFSVVDVRAAWTSNATTTIGVPEASKHRVTDRSRLAKFGNYFVSSVRSGHRGSSAHRLAMSAADQHNSVTMSVAKPIWHLKTKLGGSGDTQEIKFAGQTNMACPIRAFCSSYTCGRDLVKVAHANETLCKGSVCTKVDEQTCCQYPECADDRTLVFDTIVKNNLNGEVDKDAVIAGDITSKSVVYGDVFRGSDLKVDLKVGVRTGTPYYPRDASLNGLDGPFGKINWETGTHVDLDFKFLEQGTDKPVQVPSFFLTFSGIDMQQVAGGVESVTVYDHSWYRLPVPAAVRADDSCDGLNTTITALEPGGDEGALANPMSLTGALLNHSATFRMPGQTSFQVTLRATSGWAGRNILFAGPSSIVCGTKSSCLTLKCQVGFKLRPDAHMKACSDSECQMERDHELCCAKSGDMDKPLADNVAATAKGVE